jgi:hypothetical protein
LHRPSEPIIDIWCGGFDVPIGLAATSCRNFQSKTALEP